MSALMSTYAPLNVRFTHGTGALLFDDDGREYLDGLSGIAVTNLGHAHPGVTAAIKEQAGRLLHCSNIYRIDAQEQAGEALVEFAAMDRVFFSNSGAEANEAAIKLARLAAQRRGIGKPQIVVLEGAFHGRTMGALSASGSTAIQAGFDPLLPGFLRVPRNDLEALRRITDARDDIAAIMLEPVQGESGIFPLEPAYLEGVGAVCKEKGLMLVFDEVQSGNGRTGTPYYFHQLSVTPDVVTTAKALGNGVPIGACMARGDAASVFAPGNHGSTYGGNPLACAAASAVLHALTTEDLMPRATSINAALLAEFTGTLRNGHAVTDIRSAGLMIGIQLGQSCAELVGLALEAGLLINVTAGSTIRLLPPLVMSNAQACEFGERLAVVVDHWADQQKSMAGAA